MRWKRKDLMGLEELEPWEIELVLDTAEACKGIFSRDIKKLPYVGRQWSIYFMNPAHERAPLLKLLENG